MSVPGDLLYTKEHEWVKIEGKRGRVGIDDFAQGSLGDITFIELPKIGDECKQFAQIATVESVKAASDIFAPISGKIVQVNEAVLETPELVNQSPYEDAWFFVVELSDPSETKNLMDASKYSEFLKENS